MDITTPATAVFRSAVLAARGAETGGSTTSSSPTFSTATSSAAIGATTPTASTSADETTPMPAYLHTTALLFLTLGLLVFVAGYTICAVNVWRGGVEWQEAMKKRRRADRELERRWIRRAEQRERARARARAKAKEGVAKIARKGTKVVAEEGSSDGETDTASLTTTASLSTMDEESDVGDRTITKRSNTPLLVRPPGSTVQVGRGRGLPRMGSSSETSTEDEDDVEAGRRRRWTMDKELGVG